MLRGVEELKKEAMAISSDFNKVKQDVGKTKQKAEAEAPLTDENGDDTPLKEELENLNVANLHEVELALEEAQRKADSIDANPDVIRQYEVRKKEIAELEVHLEDITTAKDMKVANLANMRRRWEDALINNLTEVDSRFSRYMEEMGCTGTIKLYRGESEDGAGDFKNWGIHIEVSFRENTKASVLSAQRHSGGERSVATIMYLMALQDLMVAPFRCVDEINQGLDERNERLVFRRIVENSCRKPVGSSTNHSGQYFLITPKLLPNLYDMENEAITILFVCNGPFNFNNPEDWNPKQLIGNTKRRSHGGEENAANGVVSKTKSKKSRVS
jgi:chromosome segregation ATPase